MFLPSGGAFYGLRLELSNNLRHAPELFVVLQGPLLNTLNDFWRMVYERKSKIIIMLTQFAEKTADGKSIEKSAMYLPSNVNDVVFFGSIVVMLMSQVGNWHSL